MLRGRGLHKGSQISVPKDPWPGWFLGMKEDAGSRSMSGQHTSR